MNAYSEDLRQKIVEAVHRGTPKSEVARLLGVSLSSVKRYARLAREGKPLAPRKAPGKRPKIGEKARRLLEADLEERPAGTLEERRRFLERVAGVRVSESTVSRMLKRLGWTRKKIDGRERTGRVVEGGLAGADRPRGGRPEAGFRRRVRHAHLVGAALRLGTPGRTGSRAGAAQSRQEHDALGEHDGRRDGPLHGGGRQHDHRGLRGLRRAGAGTGLEARADRGDGQPGRPQGRAGARTRGGERLRAFVLAALLSGPQPHRGGVLEGQDLPAARRGSNTRGAGGGYGASARRGDAPGRTRLLQTLRLRPSGSISMTDAVVVGG